ncbi:MAG TPA: methyltransferase domain-containing protein [Burkholderiales bacterium]|nr:methyltransferase domain-containing protein [Burkholderiales bacterium]
MKRSWYDRHVLPYAIDLACGMKDVRRQREQVVPLARGRVLEIGIGTGLNLMHYDESQVEEIVGLDPALEMHRLAKKRLQRTGLKLSLVDLSAERIPFDDAAFDTVLMTYTLCSIPDPVSALKEMRRVLKPGAKLIFCEHGASPDASVRRWQDRLTPLWSKIAGGCRLDRDVPALLKEAGLASSDLETTYLPGPRPVTYHYRGTASAV